MSILAPITASTTTPRPATTRRRPNCRGNAPSIGPIKIYAPDAEAGPYGFPRGPYAARTREAGHEKRYSLLIRRRKPWDLPANAVTPERVYLNRRRLLAAGGAAALMGFNARDAVAATE